MTPCKTLRDGDGLTAALVELCGPDVDAGAVARWLLDGLPEVAPQLGLAPEADVVELHRRLGRLEQTVRSLLVAGDDMARDLGALHYEGRPSAAGWQGVADLARAALEVGW